MGLIGNLDALTERHQKFAEMTKRLDEANIKRRGRRKREKTDLTAKDESDIKPDPSPA